MEQNWELGRPQGNVKTLNTELTENTEGTEKIWEYKSERE